MVEGGVDDAILHSLFFGESKDLFFDAVIVILAGLQFNVDGEGAWLDEFKYLLHRRNGGVVIFGMCPVEVEFLQLCQRIVFDAADAVGGAVNGFVVADDDFTVLCQLDVEFDAVGFHVDGFLKCFEGVFGRVSRGSPMGPDQWFHNIFLSFPQLF